MKKLFGIIILTVLFLNIVKAQTDRVKFITFDKIPVTADLYIKHPATAPMIILFHQATYSRGEYTEIAPKLNDMGFNCMAVDLRSGGDVNGVRNETWAWCDSLMKDTKMTDAYYDVQAAVKFAKSKYPGAKIILMGSSYSASLALKYAGDYPNSVSGVVAFSPAEYFSKFGWSRTIIQATAARITCPVFIASSATEQIRWQAIYDAIPHQNKVSYVPGEGKHGAKTLWSTFPESKGYWTALGKFLARFK